MKISVNDQELFTLSEVQKKVIQSQIPAEMFEADVKRRLNWLLVEEHYGNRFKQLKTEWDEKLKGRLASVPTDPDAYAQLVFSQPDYKDASAKNAEAKAAREARAQVQ